MGSNLPAKKAPPGGAVHALTLAIIVVSFGVPALGACALARRAAEPGAEHPAAGPSAVSVSQTAVAPASAVSWPVIGLKRALSGVDQPVWVTNAGDGSGRLFIVERPGRIRIAKGSKVLSTPFLDIRSRVQSGYGEQGLLCIAFPPRYAGRRHFYVYYTDINGDVTVSRFRLTSNDIADPASERVLLTINHRQNLNHDGGQLAFGPDGYLYIGTGDGGGGGDPLGNGQNAGVLLAKILRIDVESAPGGYTIPSTNPFVGQADKKPEIWAYGLRNPWRFSFDPSAGDLYIGDVGQDLFEEIDFQAAHSRGGENYGWNLMEGNHPYPPGSPTPTAPGLVAPVVEYPHGPGDSIGCSVIGGFVYRGSLYPDLQGFYLYGDLCSGRIWGLKRIGGHWRNRQLLKAPMRISTFGVDEAGRVYVTDYDRGVVYLIRGRSAVSRPAAPSSIRRGVAFLVSGTVRPGHAGATRLLLFRLVGPVFRLARSVGAVQARLPGDSTYRATVRLAKTGRWRIAAYHTDSAHLPTTSPFRYVTVR